MPSLKKRTINGIIWSSIENILSKGIAFIIGIILARLLSPKDFGLIGMITIFISISQTFINSGFSQALIRKKKCTDLDYSTVFYFNLIVGFFFFILLFFSAPLISIFFHEPQLSVLVKLISIVLIIDSLTIIQRTKLTKEINFKLQTKISIISNVISGIVSIYMAYSGYGVWSLVFQILTKQFLNSTFLWFWNRWRPVWVFSFHSFSELFSFGSKLLLSSLIYTFYNNIYYLLIGKFFTVKELGYYTRAEQFNNLPSANLESVMSRVTYPVLAEVQDDPQKLKSGYRKIIKSIMLITMILMIGLAAVSEPLIITLIGEKWRQSVIYLQMLTFVGMLYPLRSLNLNMLQIKGRSNLILRLEIIKTAIAIPIIFIGLHFGIKTLILGLWMNSLIAYFLNSFWSGRMVDYSLKEQLADISSGFLIAIIMGILVFVIGWFLPFSSLFVLITQIIFGILISLALCEIFKPVAYLDLKFMVKQNFV